MNQKIRKIVMSIMSCMSMLLPIIFRSRDIFDAAYNGALNRYFINFLLSKEFIVIFSYILMLTIISSGLTIFIAIVALIRNLHLKMRL